MRTTEFQTSGAMFYHNGESRKDGYSPTSMRVAAPPTIDKRVIAWDMEGISLGGLENPQHAVLFGNSAEVTTPISAWRLSTRDMLEYLIQTAEKYPYALHVGYAFKYDANMIIAGLSERHITTLWKTGRVTFRFDQDYVWSIRWVPGKMFTVTKRWGTRRNTRAKTSVTVYDFFSFFGQKFLNVCEQILGTDLTDDDREVIAHGKAQRGKQGWEDMPEIRHYWEREIVLMQRVFERFRDVMYHAGFALKEWYGPGALANYINASRGIRDHLTGVQVTGGILPEAVHRASKSAFSGGRFEVLRAGRVRGPVYSIDINSAYPFALTHLPSFASGRWVHTLNPKKIELFGIYRIQWKAPNASPLEYRPMPLFWRDNRGLISYPQIGHGWYFSPEAQIVNGLAGFEILEGWHWETESEERPWKFLQSMYDKRQAIGKKNVLSMPFKLGPNSLYGKYAQTVGWDQEKNLPPKSHALPVAGWVTSYCRAMLWSIIRQAPSSVIAVETDSVFMTKSPAELGISIGDELGQWGLTTYDEVIYMQSGMYHTKTDGVWQGVKSRGMNAAEFPIEKMEQYLLECIPGEEWPEIALETAPRFIGAGAAIASSEDLKSIHTSWRKQTKRTTMGKTGKRVHIHKSCPTCASGISPDEKSHPLIVNSRSDGQTLSFERRLPWEKAHTAEVQEYREKHELERELAEVGK
jgi:hypothetical protein